MQKKIPKMILTLFNAFAESNFELYMVGGCVRDMILGNEPHDFDMTTNAEPETIALIAKKNQWQYAYTGEKYGTVTVFFDEKGIEITTYRIDATSSDGRRPDAVTFTSDLIQDLARRDLTINAIAYAPQVGIVDPFAGQTDLMQQHIRTVGDPDIRFREDYLRMLRAVRFATRLNFTIAVETKAAISENATNVSQISKERLRKELTEIICSVHALYGISVLTETKLWEYIFPEINMNISALRHIADFPQEEHWRWLAISLALCESIEAVQKMLQQLTLGQKNEQWIFKLYQCVRTLERATTLVEVKFALATLSDEERNQFVALLAFVAIDKSDEIIRILSEKQPLRIDELAITGHDLLALGISGQQIGTALTAAQKYVFIYPEQNTKLVLLKALHEEGYYE